MVGLLVGLLPRLSLLHDRARLTAADQAPPPTAARLIVSGGHILTLGEPAAVEAIAVGAGRILALGDRATVDRWRGPDTLDYDLAGRVLAPAFVDHHVHLLNVGLSLPCGRRGSTPRPPTLRAVSSSGLRTAGPPGRCSSAPTSC